MPQGCVFWLCLFVLVVSAISPVDDDVQRDFGTPTHVRVSVAKAGPAARTCSARFLALAIAITRTQPTIARSERPQSNAPRYTAPNESFRPSLGMRPPPTRSIRRTEPH
jgi:hypothetical protein